MSTDAMTHPEHGETVTAALGHINGWYTADAGRMQRAASGPGQANPKQLIAPVSWWWPTSAHVS